MKESDDDFEHWVNRWQYLLITSTLLFYFFRHKSISKIWGWSLEDGFFYPTTQG